MFEAEEVELAVFFFLRRRIFASSLRAAMAAALSASSTRTKKKFTLILKYILTNNSLSVHDLSYGTDVHDNR